LPKIAKVHRRLGVGSFGHVYQCSIIGSSEQVAVKVLLRAPRAEKDREANLLKQLAHPNLIRLWDHIQSDDIHALVFELCTGGSLQAFLHGTTAMLAMSFKLHERLKAMVGIVSAIEYLHSQSIVHRDVKSANCFLSSKAMATAELPPLKLGDLGLARPLANESMTRGIGTIRYMAPEVITSHNYGLAADIFSLGVMLHEVASGQVPFGISKRNDGVLAASIVQGNRPSSSALPQGAILMELPQVLESCWAADVNLRLTAPELLEHLASAVNASFEGNYDASHESHL